MDIILLCSKGERVTHVDGDRIECHLQIREEAGSQHLSLLFQFPHTAPISRNNIYFCMRKEP